MTPGMTPPPQSKAHPVIGGGGWRGGGGVRTVISGVNTHTQNSLYILVLGPFHSSVLKKTLASIYFIGGIACL